jgi:thiol-disulfide isomerase/thioredoxin
MKKLILISMIICSSTAFTYQSLITLNASTRGTQNPTSVIDKHAQDKAVIMFCKAGCPFCSYLNPKFRTFAQNNQNKAQFIVVNVGNDTSYKSRYGFSTYPTVIYKQNGKTIRTHGSNNGNMTVKQMEQHLNSFK